MALVASAGIASAVAVVGGLVGGASVTSIVVGAVVTFAVSMTTSLIAKSKNKQDDTPETETQGNQTVIRSATSPAKLLYGETFVSGTLVYSAVTGSNNEWLYLVVVLSAHPVDSIGAVYFDERHEDDPLVAGYVDVSRHLGGENQLADAEMVSTFGEWSHLHRLRGMAYVVAKVKIDPNDESAPFRNVPNIKARVRGRRVVDPRIDGYKDQTILDISPNTDLNLWHATYDNGFSFYIETVGLNTLPIGNHNYLFGGSSNVNDARIFAKQTAPDVAEFAIVFDGDVRFYVPDVPLSPDGEDVISVFYDEHGIVLLVNDWSTTVGTPAGLVFSLGIWNQDDDGLKVREWRTAKSNIAFPDNYLVRWHDETTGAGQLPNHGSLGDVIIDTGTTVFVNTESDNPDNWHRVFSKNSALVILDYMTNSRFGLAVDWSKIDVDDFKYNADICAEPDPANNDPCPRFRYSIDGVVNTQNPLGNNLSGLLTSCGGVVTWSNGFFRLVVGAPSPAVFTIDSSMIIDTVEMAVVSSKSAVFNTVKAKYISATQLWQDAETPLYTDDTALDDDGAVIMSELDLPYTDNTYTAQRLAIMYLKLSRLEGRLSLRCTRDVYALRSMDVVTVDIPEVGINAELWRVADWELEPTTVDETGGVLLHLTEYDESAYNIPPELIRPPYDVPTLPTKPTTIDPPTGLYAYNDDNTTTPEGDPAVLVQWDVSTNPWCKGYRLTTDIAGNATTRFISGRLNTSFLDALPVIGDTVTYTLTAVLNETTESAGTTIVYTVLPVGYPQPPTGLVVTPQSENNGIATWTLPPVPTTVGVEIRGTIGHEYQSGYMRLHENTGAGVYITGRGAKYSARSYSTAGKYSSVVEYDQMVQPVADQYNPQFDWGVFEYHYNTPPVSMVGFVATHKSAFVPTDQTPATANDWATFDVFVQNPEPVNELVLAQWDVVTGNEIQFDVALGSRLPHESLTDDGNIARLRVAVQTRTAGVWDNYFSNYDGLQLQTVTIFSGVDAVRIITWREPADGVVFGTIFNCRVGGNFEP